MRLLLVIAALDLGCRATPDACQGALDRLARIHASRGFRPLAARWSDEVLARCRRDPAAEPDPVMRCALDGAIDDDARACIERFVRAVVPAAPGGPGAVGQGKNPLLE